MAVPHSLAEPVSGDVYTDLQLSMFEMMQDQGVTCDRALARCGQPIFLPNIPPARRDSDGAPIYYHYAIERGQGFFAVQGSRVWSRMEARREADRLAMEQAAQDRARRAAERAQRAAERGDDVDPVAAFNAAHMIGDLLSRYGYEQQGRSDHWRSRYQTTGSYATRDFDDHWVSLSGSDMAAGIGQVKGEYCWGDAFDLYCHYEHDGNMTAAVRAYGKELRGGPFDPPRSNLDDFNIVTTAAPEQPDLEWPTPVRDVDEESLPRRRWVYAHHHIRSFVSVTASAGGIGKTSLTMVEAASVAIGNPLLGEPVREQTNAWIINLEDPREELELRLAAVKRHYGLTHADLSGRLFMDGEDDLAITLAAETREGVTRNDALLALMTQRIRDNNIGLVILDPFISVHEVNENSNMSIGVVVTMLRKLARDTDAAIHVVHHVRKGNGQDSDIDSVRGAGSMIGAARAARVINRVSADEAARLGIPEIEARGLFSVTDGKANLAPPPDAQVYRRMIGVKLDNDEWVGVAAGYKLPDQWAGMTDRVVNQILDKIDAGPENGEKWSLRTQDKDRWVGRVIMQQKFGDPLNAKTDIQAKAILKKWMEEGLLEEVTYKSENQRKDRKGVVSTARVGEQN